MTPDTERRTQQIDNAYEVLKTALLCIAVGDMVVMDNGCKVQRLTAFAFLVTSPRSGKVGGLIDGVIEALCDASFYDIVARDEWMRRVKLWREMDARIAEERI